MVQCLLRQINFIRDLLKLLGLCIKDSSRLLNRDDRIGQILLILHAGRNDLAGCHIDHGQSFDVDRLGIGLICDFLSGFQLRPGKNTEPFKQLNRLSRGQNLRCLNRARNVRKAALFRFFYPVL